MRSLSEEEEKKIEDETREEDNLQVYMYILVQMYTSIALTLTLLSRLKIRRGFNEKIINGAKVENYEFNLNVVAHI